jgi:hypothetical protein
MQAAANTHRALRQDEVHVTTELLEDVLASDNLAQAWKRVKANKGAPGIDGMTIEDFPAQARAHWSAVRQQIKEGRYQPQRRYSTRHSRIRASAFDQAAMHTRRSGRCKRL